MPKSSRVKMPSAHPEATTAKAIQVTASDGILMSPSSMTGPTTTRVSIRPNIPARPSPEHSHGFRSMLVGVQLWYRH